MFRKRLVATVAAAPLLLFASQALAEITITDTKTVPVLTSAGADALRITSAGKVKPTATAGGGSVIVDSNHNFTNEGEIATRDIDSTAGVLINGGVTANVLNKAVITVDDSFSPTDSDKDGIIDGPLAEGTDRYGIRLTGPGTFTGNLTNDVTGSINVLGNNSAGISIESAFTGTLLNRGSIGITGSNTYGIHILDTAPVTGTVNVMGSISALGENTVALALDGDVFGAVKIQAGITSRGYRFATRPTTAAGRALLQAEDMLQGGGGVRISGNVTGGILFDVPPPDLSTTVTDEDGDGFEDASEGSTGIAVQGSAPAILIGSNTENLTIGAVGAGDLAYGLVVRGGITADGLLDDVSATGIQLGGNAGFSTTFAGGVRLQGSVTARTFNGEATGLAIRPGTVVDKLWNQGTLYALSVSTSAPLPTEDSFNIRGIRIDPGATVNTVRNDGNITATVTGERSNAIAFQDLSGTVDVFTNTRVITALIVASDDADDSDDADNDTSNELVVGRAIAIDLRFATGNTTVVQFGINDGDDDGVTTTTDPDEDADGVDDGDEPVIFGEVLFGTGNDLLDLQNGILVGSVSFGAGADTLRLTGGAEARSDVTDSDGLLNIDVAAGSLTLLGTAAITATNLNVGATSTLVVTADPDAGTNSQINATTATLATGAKIGLELQGLISGPERYVIVHTDTPGGLTVGTLDQSLLGNSPYLMVAQASSDTTLGEVYLDVRRRTAIEMNLSGNEALALNAVYDALNGDEDVRDAFLGASTRDEFLDLYQQMLPDQGEGLFSAVDNLTSAVSRLTAAKPDLRQRYGPDSFWMQEVNVEVMRDAGVALGSETKAFGFVGGYESMGADGGALGATLAFISAEEKDDVAQIGEETTISLLEAGLYWRRSMGGWLFSARGSGGYAWFDGDRVFVSPTDSLIRQADAGWTGFTGLASASAAYEASVGAFFIRPRISVDYLYLSEGSRQETGGEDAFNLFIEERTSSRLSGTAEVALGATFGRELWWRPEVRFGYRQRLAGEMGDTIFRFKNGQLVALPPSELGDNAVIIGLSLKAGTPMSYVAMEAEYEATDGEDRYNLQIAGRMMF